VVIFSKKQGVMSRDRVSDCIFIDITKLEKNAEQYTKIPVILPF